MSHKKQIFKLSILKRFLNDANSCVSLVPSTRLLALPPFFLNDMKSGIFYLLNSILKKYDRSLDGIIIGYQNVKILMDENTGIIPIGSAETEVNVSVEFYIFQPKIGNPLEGECLKVDPRQCVHFHTFNLCTPKLYPARKIFPLTTEKSARGVINKKSNNHIGCLVHQYFNATILKPEDVAYEHWNCKDFEVNDKILFTVKDLDFTGLLPYIEGIVNNEDLLQCSNSKKKAVCDLDVHKGSQNKMSKNISNESLASLMCKSQILKEDTLLDNNVNSLLENVLNEDSHKKKKKKKKSKEKQEEGEKDRSLSASFTDVVLNDTVKESKDDDAQEDKSKKKKKKRKKDAGEESSNLELFKKEEEKNTLAEFLLRKFSHGDDDNDFAKPIKIKKEKKKKKEKESSRTLNKMTEELPKHNDFFYSTQLEPHLETKMNSSCSPIPKRMSNAFNDKPEPSPILYKEKKKDRKRKAGDSSDSSSAKKVKKNDTQINGSASLVDELLRQELNRIKDELNMSEKKKEEKPAEERNFLYEKLMKQAKSEIASDVNKESESDSSSKKKKKHKERKVKNGSMCDDKSTPEKASGDKSLLSEQSLQSSEKKSVNGVSSSKKTLIQTMLDQFFQPQEKKVKSDSEKETAKRESVKKETKPKSTDKEKAESLYEKLLREARSMIETREDSPPKKKRKTK